MIDIKLIEINKELIIKNLNKRNVDFTEQVNDIFNLNQIRKEKQKEVDDKRFLKNQLTSKFTSLQNENEKDKLKEEIKVINWDIENLDNELKEIQYNLNKILYTIPNLIDDQVPLGEDDSQNIEVKSWEPTNFYKQNLNHWEIAEKLDLVDFKLGTKLSGSRFVVYKNKGAKLIRAIGSVLLEFHEKNGYNELIVPVIVNDNIMTGTGQLPKFEEDLYKISDSSQYLIPTSEVPLTNYYNNEIIDQNKLPLYLTANSLCFRKEAGSAGKDTKGIIRMHQFNKVEMVKIVKPENSWDELEKMVNDTSQILQLFNLKHRVVVLCSGDIGFSASKTYDLEVWFPGQEKFREISSCSNCTDFQARRMNTKFKTNDSLEYVHTLNGSGLAIDRLFAAILENYYKDGKLYLPEVLKPFFNNQDFI